LKNSPKRHCCSDDFVKPRSRPTHTTRKVKAGALIR
jgi:hypothetical protein